MGEMGYSRSTQYEGLLVRLYRRILSLLRRTPNYHKLLYADDDDGGVFPRRSRRFSFKARSRRVKVVKFRSKPAAAGASAAAPPSGSVSSSGETVVRRPRSARSFRIRLRRKSVTVPLVAALRKVRDAYVSFMIRLASSSTVSHIGGICGGQSIPCGSFPSSYPFVDRVDRDLVQGLKYLAQSRPASLSRLRSVSETSAFRLHPISEEAPSRG